MKQIIIMAALIVLVASAGIAEDRFHVIIIVVRESDDETDINSLTMKAIEDWISGHEQKERAWELQGLALQKPPEPSRFICPPSLIRECQKWKLETTTYYLNPNDPIYRLAKEVYRNTTQSESRSPE